jgi:hypothetical protein
MSKKILLNALLKQEYTFSVIPRCLIEDRIQTTANNLDLLTRLAGLDLSFERIGITQFFLLLLAFGQLFIELGIETFPLAMQRQTCEITKDEQTE